MSEESELIDREFKKERREKSEGEGIDIDDLVKRVRGINPRIWTVLMIIGLFILFYQLGYIMGYREAFSGQQEYYETKIDYYCYCQKEMNIVTDNPMNMPKLEIDFDK